MADNKGEHLTKKHISSSSSSPKDQLDQEYSTETKTLIPPHPHHHSPSTIASSPFISSTPLYIPTSSSPNFDPQQQFEPVLNPKRPKYTSAQWKPLPSPNPSSQQQKHSQITALITAEPPHTTTVVSSSETESSPSHSHSSTKPPKLASSPLQHQLRKGKYVSPVWKPNEMLWLARAWKAQYQGGGDQLGGGAAQASGCDSAAAGMPSSRGKTRAEKDREVAEFLNRHGVSRDAKTAGTKWDNMLGEFRKVFEWERGGGEQVGKSYFRLSPYERKQHRLPASFDEEVFEELSQFMGSKIRTPQGRGHVSVSAAGSGDDSRSPLAVAAAMGAAKALQLPRPPFRDEDVSLSGSRTKQIILPSGREAYFHGSRGSLVGFESPPLDISLPSASTSLRQVVRIGKVRMTWEESVSLWGEEGDHHGARVKVDGLNFLEADELTFLDDSMVASTMEAFEDGPLKGFSVDRFLPGQQIKVFGRRKSSSSSRPTTAIPPGSNGRSQLPSTDPSNRYILPPWEFQDPTEYYMGCLRLPPPTLPTLLELSWHLQEPPQEELRFPLRKDVYRDLPQGRELFFTTSEPLDCRAATFDLLSPIIKSNPSLTASTASSRDSFIGLWDDCINWVVARFCSNIEMVRKSPKSSSLAETTKDQWPNVTGFLRGFCVWRGEESDQLREGQVDPSSSIVQKLFWSYADLPYLLGYYAVGYIVTFCALSRSQDHRIIRTDLYALDLSSPAERMKALVPCWRIAGLLPLLADRCFNFINNGNSQRSLLYTDFERIDLFNGNITETTPTTVIRYFPTKRKWAAVKEIYDFLDCRVPHTEHILKSCENDLALVFKPRGCKLKPANCDQLVDALKHVTEALVALHDLSFMHRDLGWDKVMRGVEEGGDPWFLVGFDEAVGAPQIYPQAAAAGGRHAPEMRRGLHGVKVDVWGVGQLIKSCGLVGVPKLLRDLQNRCLDHNPEQRPTAADCYHHLMQLQSSLQSAAASVAAAAAGRVVAGVY